MVRGRYWVLLDEVVTPEPQPVELRFHSYGVFEQNHAAGWFVSEETQGLDVLPLLAGFSAAVEKPAGWIRPVNVLRLSIAEPASDTLSLIVLHPRSPGSPPAEAVLVGRSADRLLVQVGAEQIAFTRSENGWTLAGVAGKNP
jgi:hypothetical protein